MSTNLRKKSEIPFVLMAMPAVAVFITFFILPLVFTIRYSFYNWTNFSPDVFFVGLNNYKTINEQI
ncbi:MAG: hypothetical protein E7F15_14600 [Clostridiales bacterium]|nr:hypothetical protein [Clostridiales bacterium]